MTEDTETRDTQLVSLIHERDFSTLRAQLTRDTPPDVAALLEQLSTEEQVLAFRVLPRRHAANVFEYLPLEVQEQLLKAMAQEELAAILNDMSPDDRTSLLDELPAKVTKQLMMLLTPDERSVATTLLGYPEGSIGRLMTPDYVRVRPNWTITEALDHIRRYGQDSETLNHVYVVDEQGLLIDDIRMRQVLLSPPNSRIADIMDHRFVALKATDDQEAAVMVFMREDRTVLPVTDTAGVLIGIITIDDVLDVAEAEATEDIQKIGGTEALDEPYMHIALPRMIRKRAGWLVVLFFGEMLTASALAYFEEELRQALVLTLFIPLIIASGGNSGSQAATLVIRALSVGEVHLRDWWRVFRRELVSGLSLGFILGTIGFLRISLWSTFSNAYGQYWFLIGLTVACTLIGIVLLGTITGSMLPLALKRLGFDPATSSAPFVTTIVDVTGLILYFTIALTILGGVML